METVGYKLENSVRAYSFDELLFLPGFARMSPKDIDLSFTLDGLNLKVPLISAPMDTVTEADMAIALALKGGLGVIHRNCTVEEAVEMVEKVKRAKIPSECNDIAIKDAKGRLAVGAGISPLDMARCTALSERADLLFTDVTSFHNAKLMEGTKNLIKETNKRLVIGNFGAAEGVAQAVKELGAENIAAIKVGMGGGSICTTTDITGVGSPAAFAVEQAARALGELKLIDRIPIIADGGIRCAKDVAFCLGLGASLAMLGNLFARCEESPGETVVKEGKRYKVYWGMGSAEARKKRFALDRYQDYGKGKKIDEGIAMHVPIEGSVSNAVEKLTSELRVTMGYVGARNIREMREVSNIAVMAARAPKVVADRGS
jgi:IMP dehydrogenase